MTTIINIFLGILGLIVLGLVLVILYSMFIMPIALFPVTGDMYKKKITGKKMPLNVSPIEVDKKTFLPLDEVIDFLGITDDDLKINTENELMLLNYKKRNIRLTSDAKQVIINVEGKDKIISVEGHIVMSDNSIMVSTDKLRDMFNLKIMQFTSKNIILVIPN